MDFTTVHNGDIALNVAIEGKGPLILCVHGWPELWYSWRHQIRHFSERRYAVAAMDVRGYGDSSRPEPVEAYTMRNLASDVAAVADHLGGGKAILLGHDWGAPIVWTSALLHPGIVTAVIGLSVPFTPIGDLSFVDIATKIYAGRFFYQSYFQAEGVAEAELEADIPASLRKIYFAASGDARPDIWFADKPADAKFFDGMIDPQPFPAWMSTADLDVYVSAFRKTGFRGPLNRYRAQRLDPGQLTAIKGKPVTQPSYFIAGERDIVRRIIPGSDRYADPGAACTDFRGSVIIPKVGHWVQQEAPAETNAAIEEFLSGL
ncbi:alpha/beta fold hydrolase [Bradyrhizobium sp. HKCCYLS1011]|uniref:alpha/beta fold hydrolase n=1 Tax=Bradyrhizobium sp. HKCCYLS1011 TaxID=3420733 RepID=UPI003EB82FD4